VTGVGTYEVEMWIWCLPGMDGLMGAEFAMDYPAGVIPGTADRNTIYPVQIGDLSSEDGVAISASECQTDWVWLFRQTLHITSDEPMEVRLEGSTLGNFVYEWPIHTSCEDGFPIYHLYALNYLYINYSSGSVECAMLGTKNKSWGAIKSLFR
jgi:hypothetical protein